MQPKLSNGQRTHNLVSIPQAVSTVATLICLLTAVNYFVSIPQAVSTVATPLKQKALTVRLHRFNTASGKHCCNAKNSMKNLMLILVSIPQAVSTVATFDKNLTTKTGLSSFNTASGKHCCNKKIIKV